MSDWLLTEEEMEKVTGLSGTGNQELVGHPQIARAQLRKVVEKMERLQSMNPLLLHSWQWHEFRKEAGLT